MKPQVDLVVSDELQVILIATWIHSESSLLTLHNILTTSLSAFSSLKSTTCRTKPRVFLDGIKALPEAGNLYSSFLDLVLTI